MNDAPLFSAADARYLDDLADRRDEKGSDWCREKGVGRERAKLDARPANVTPIFTEPKLESGLQLAREMNRMILAIFCRSCGRCELGQE